MVDVLLLLDSEEPETQPEDDRGVAYDFLIEESHRAREQLIGWLKGQGLWDEVKELGEPNAFNIIPCICSSRVAALIHQAPGVGLVTPGDIPIGLIE